MECGEAVTPVAARRFVFDSRLACSSACVSPPTQVPRSTLGMTGCFFSPPWKAYATPPAQPTQPVIPSVERGTWVGGDAQHLPGTVCAECDKRLRWRAVLTLTHASPVARSKSGWTAVTGHRTPNRWRA